MGLLPCDFCDEFSGGRNNAFYSRYGSDLRNRTIFYTQNFKVLPSLGQIVEGHVLIVPVRHYTALADMPRGPVEEMSGLAHRVRVALSINYGPCLLFEHGSRGDNSGGCGIYHAHLHAVPAVGSRDPICALKGMFRHQRLEGITEVGTKARGLKPYLYYEDTNSNSYLFEVDYLPSQYMRKLLVEMMGEGEWDWRKCGREEALLSTIARLSQAFGPGASKPTASEPANAAAGRPS